MMLFFIFSTLEHKIFDVRGNSTHVNFDSACCRFFHLTMLELSDWSNVYTVHIELYSILLSTGICSMKYSGGDVCHSSGNELG